MAISKAQVNVDTWDKVIHTKGYFQERILLPKPSRKNLLRVCGLGGTFCMVI